jgi:diguanylate cyclase (GGDEF)-like protein/PAS domain S-box-containing protein
LRSKGLRIRLLVIAIIAGVSISAGLIALQYVQYSRANASIASTGERSLLAADAQRLDVLADDVIANQATPLENALRAGDSTAVGRIGARVMENPTVVSVRILDADGAIVFSDARTDEFTRRLAPEEMRTQRRDLGRGDSIGVIQVTVGRPGLVASARTLQLQLQNIASRDFTRSIIYFSIGGAVITFVLAMFAWTLARRLERPIVEMIRSTERIGEGDYTRPHKVTSSNEIAELEVALDHMRQKLAQTTITKNYLTTVLNSMHDAVLVTAPDGTVKRVNDAAVRLFGYTDVEMCGRQFLEFLAENEREAFSLEAAGIETRETVVATRSGQTIPVSLSGAPIAGDDPQFQGSIFVIRNITDRKRAERRIRYLARFDALTKVPNRMQFQHMLQQALARARRAERGIVLLYLDVDRFKEMNDTFGHAAGDRTLEVLSERLTRILPREAVVGRLAGDEFGLFIEGFAHGEEEQAQAANLARLVLAEVCKAFYVDQQEVFLTASVGIAFCPKDAENVIDLIRNADAAMYHSKQNGGNSFAFYSPDMNAAAVERLMLKSKLRRALERDELVMFYQPKVDLRDGRIIGAEALLRWRLPGHGDIPPSQFIPLAEETNLILGIGEWVLNRVCADYKRWSERMPKVNAGRVSINLSLKQLRQASFITRCKSVFRRHDVSPTSFELEITETTLMADPKRTVKLLDELYAMGLHLSIDDFGTGYSSLSALQQFPIGTLKIDQSFVRDAAFNSDDATIVRTIIDMGKALEVEVVAEGVETEEQFNFLRERGCNYAQGRLFGDAMSADSFVALVQAQASGKSQPHKVFGGTG